MQALTAHVAAPGNEEPLVKVCPPGPASQAWLAQMEGSAAPMGPRRRESPLARELRDGQDVQGSRGIVYAEGRGCNVVDVDGNRYVDLAAGFGALLLGHGHPEVLLAIERQASTLLQALGDVYPSRVKIELAVRLAALYPEPGARVILGQSGADAISAALKSAVLFTGKPGIVAFNGSYHGLSYGPLAACGLRASYRVPFRAQLNSAVTFIDYPRPDTSARVLEQVRAALMHGDVGCVLVEPVLGRGGCLPAPPGFLGELLRLTREHGALLIADEVWTGLGRAGRWLYSLPEILPDLICLGKGLGGGVPISACVGSGEVLAAWSRDEEVVHTATFAGAPLACAAALATLDVLSREHLVERAARVGSALLGRVQERLGSAVTARGAGLMIAIELGADVGGARAGAATRACQRLLGEGYVLSTGGGQREVLVMTPPLLISEALLDGFVGVLAGLLEDSHGN